MGLLVVLRTMVHVMMMMHLGSLVLLMMLGQVLMVCLLRMVMLVVVVVPDWLLIVATVVRGVSRVLVVVLMMLVVVVVMRVHWRRRGHRVVRISWVQGQVIASAMVVVWVVARLRILGMNLEFGSDNSHFIRVWKFSRPW